MATQHIRRSEDFHVGQRVRLSEHAKVNGVTVQARARNRGTVVAIRPPFAITVRPDGYKTALSFCACMWEPTNGVKR